MTGFEFCEASRAPARDGAGEFSEARKKVPTSTERTDARLEKNRAFGGSDAALIEQVISGVYQAADRTLSAALSSPDRPASVAPSRPDRGEFRDQYAPAREVRVLAVDIGARGAAALLDEAGALLDVIDLPTLDSGPAARPEISPHLLATIVRRWAPDRAWLEHIGPRPTDGPTGAFAFGASKATVEAVLACCGVPFRSITPATWKRAVQIPAGRGFKDLARSKAIERWPAHSELFARKLDHDRAEASLLGWAALQREKAGK